MTATSNEAGALGVLTVHAPHDSALLNVYDIDFQQVATCIGDLPKQRLKSGIYEVEAIIAGESERKLVAVRPAPAPAAVIKRDDWSLKLSSAIPLEGTQTTRTTHEEAAAEWSRKITLETPGGASRLFVFVRTVEPEKYERFAEGLSLLDASSDDELTDFTFGVQSDPAKGWLACTADLPPGPYLLTARQPGQGLRCQPLWLSAGYETHVFLPSTGTPSLCDMSVSMSPKGEGFQSNDDELVTSEAVLDGLQRGQCLLSPTQMDMLLDGKYRNPWLGILAAHALRLEAEPRLDLIKTVLGNLKEKLDLFDHPDVRALDLSEERPASRPFEHPPMLWASLKLVLQHSTRHEPTVPLGSVTDSMLDGLLADSPWVGWRESYDLELHTAVAENLQQQRLSQLASCVSMDEVNPPTTISLYEGPGGGPLSGVEAEQVSRECGLPLARVKDILLRFSEDRSLLVDLAALSRTEQAVAGYLLTRYEQSAPLVASNRNWDLLSSQVRTSLKQAAAELSRLALDSDRLIEEIPIKSIINSKVSARLMEVASREYPKAFVIGAAGVLAGRVLAKTDIGQEVLGKVRTEVSRLFKAKGPEAAQWLIKLADGLAGLDHAVLVTDYEGKVLYTNVAFEQLNGYRAASAQGGGEPKPLTDAFREAGHGKSDVKLLAPSGEEVEATLLRVQVAGHDVEQDPVAVPVAEIFKLKFKKQPLVSENTLHKFGESVSNILVSSSLLEHGAPERRQDYLVNLYTEIKQLPPSLNEPVQE